MKNIKGIIFVVMLVTLSTLALSGCTTSLQQQSVSIPKTVFAGTWTGYFKDLKTGTTTTSLITYTFKTGIAFLPNTFTVTSPGQKGSSGKWTYSDSQFILRFDQPANACPWIWNYKFTGSGYKSLTLTGAGGVSNGVPTSLQIVLTKKA